MAEMLLDSTLFQDYRRGVTGARAIVERILGGDTTASVAPLTVFELWSDAVFDRRTEIAFAGLLSFLEQAPLTAEAAKVAGIWIGSLDEDERDSLARYALIAATARERGEPVCTSDPESYSRFYSELVGY